MAALANTMSDLGRLREIVGVFTRHGFGQFFERINLGRFVPGRAAVSEPMSKEAQAQRLLHAFQDLGPTFIKFGQILSTRADVLPAEYVAALQQLQDRVPPFSFDQVQEIVEIEFGRKLEDLYASFESAPLASASIGQVHQAYTKDGQKVAVKVQRPGIGEQIRADINILYTLARLIESVVDLNVGYTPTEIVNDFERAMGMELDFVQEAANAKQFAANFRDKPYIRFPPIVDGLSGHRVLTMGFLAGVKVSEAFGWPYERRKAIAERLIEAGVQMVLSDGFFHGDPHPGNILVDAENNVIFLDVGLAGSIPKFLMDGLVQLVVASAMRDAGGVARVVYKLGSAPRRVNLAELRNDLQAILENFFSKSWGQIQASELLEELMLRGAKHGIKLPPELARLTKAILNFEGVIRQLYPELDLIAAAKPHAAQYFSQLASYERLKPELIKKGYEIFGLLQDLPLQLSQLMMDLEKGRVNVVVSGEDLRSLQSALRSLALTIFFGILTGAFVLGGLFSLATTTFLPGPVVAIGALVLAIVSGVVGFGWHIISVRLRRPKLTDLLASKRR